MAVAALTQEQQEIRSTGIGSSEIAAVAGLNPFQKPIDVYAVKRGLVPPFAGNRFTLWGDRIENVIAEAYAEENGVAILAAGTLRHPQHKWMLATPDRLVYPLVERTKPIRLLEIKNAGARQAAFWGQGEDEVPEQYLVQCQWQMAVSGIGECDLAVLIGGNDDRMYRLHADPELQAEIIEIGRKFWHENVLAGVPPPVDGSLPYSKFLAARYPRDERPMLPATNDARDLLDELRDRRAALATAEEQAEETANKLKALIGDAAGIVDIATWKATKPSRKTDWEAVAKELKAPREIVEKFTTEKPGYRRFLPNLKG